MSAPRGLTMNDRLRVAAQADNLLDLDARRYVAIADELLDAVRCCGEFPECSHVLAYFGQNVVARDQSGAVESGEAPDA